LKSLSLCPWSSGIQGWGRLVREKETHMAESATAVANGPCNVAVTESVWLVVGVSWLGYPGLSSHVVVQLPQLPRGSVTQNWLGVVRVWSTCFWAASGGHIPIWLKMRAGFKNMRCLRNNHHVDSCCDRKAQGILLHVQIIFKFRSCLVVWHLLLKRLICSHISQVWSSCSTSEGGISNSKNRMTVEGIQIYSINQRWIQMETLVLDLHHFPQLISNSILLWTSPYKQAIDPL